MNCVLRNCEEAIVFNLPILPNFKKTNGASQNEDPSLISVSLRSTLLPKNLRIWQSA